MVRVVVVLAMLVLTALAVLREPAAATIQEESCIYPDIEYPMPCDDD